MFVTFEGPEGAGKTTVIHLMAERLDSAGVPFVLTREPGAGDVGLAIRRILLDGGQIDPRTELFLFLADRANHVETLIRPALAEGKVVLCDRYVDSTIVYQGHARGQDLERLRELNTYATNGLMPELTLLLDLDPATGLARQADRDRLDSEPISFHQRVRDGFLTEARREPDRWVVIDATQDVQSVADRVWTQIRPKIA